jgi:hypothetical protein
MATMQPDQMRRSLELSLNATGVRIRRYTLDGHLDQPGLQKLDGLWADWLALRKTFYGMPADAPSAELRGIEQTLIGLDRNVDLVQRTLVSAKSLMIGSRTALLLAAALIGLAWLYFLLHGVRGLDFSNFEPIAEWGALKYVEVAFWSEFGVLCYLLFLAGDYISKRDFDQWYQPWYLATALRAPFLGVILMMVVLEFVEWYGDGTWMETFLLEEGNKSYFIAFMSFCIGLSSDQSSAILRDLSWSVADFLQGVVQRVSRKLSSALLPNDPLQK